MKSVRGRDIEKSMATSRPENIKGSGCVKGIRPKRRLALAGPHSPDAQSGKGTITGSKYTYS